MLHAELYFIDPISSGMLMRTPCETWEVNLINSRTKTILMWQFISVTMYWSAGNNNRMRTSYSVTTTCSNINIYLTWCLWGYVQRTQDASMCTMQSHVSCDWYLSWTSWRAFDDEKILGPRPMLITFLRIIIIALYEYAMGCDEDDDVHALSLCALCVCLLRNSSSISPNLPNNNIFRAFITYVRVRTCVLVQWHFFLSILLIVHRHTHTLLISV